LFAGYRQNFEWYETAVLLRKCGFVMLSVFLRKFGAAAQVVAAAMVLVVALSSHLQFRPYSHEGHNLLESIGLHACLLQVRLCVYRCLLSCFFVFPLDVTRNVLTCNVLPACFYYSCLLRCCAMY
jgi:hypothetical protein